MIQWSYPSKIQVNKFKTYQLGNTFTFQNVGSEGAACGSTNQYFALGPSEEAFVWPLTHR